MNEQHTLSIFNSIDLETLKQMHWELVKISIWEKNKTDE